MEFADVGAHCEAPLCGQRDFLPVRCDDCKLTFCATHKARPDHTCTAVASSSTSSSSSSSSVASSSVGPKHHCTRPGCVATEAVALVCPLCLRTHCFAHRSPQDHACPAAASSHLPASGAGGGGKGARPTAAAASAPASAPALANPAKPLSEKNAALVAKVRLMKVKSKTQADPKVPEAHRFFLEVLLAGATSAGSTSASASAAYICADGREPLGRILDVAAKHFKVPNPNATTTDDERRLGLFVDVAGERRRIPLDSSPADLEREGSLQNGGSVTLQLGTG
jgi:predicted nucleic acid binding AN1-type Zn finger protein